MPHAVYTRNLGLSSSQRKAMVRSLAQALIRHERIKTTLARAKETQRLVERLVTLGKDGSLSARRHAISLLNDSDLVYRLFSDVAPRFSKRQGGYTRILHNGYRAGDGAAAAVIEFVELSEALKEKPKKATKEKEKDLRVERPTPKAEQPAVKEEPKKVQEKPKTEGKPEKAEEKSKKPQEKPKGFIDGLRGFFKGRPNQ